MSRRLRKRQARVEAWLDRAFDLVAREGLDALTVTRLAQASDAAIGAMYRYFPNKEALLRALQERTIGLVGERLQAAWARLERGPEAGRPLAKAAAAFLSWSALAAHAPHAHALAVRTLADPRPLLDLEAAGRVEARLAPLLQQCAQALAEAEAAGQLAGTGAPARGAALRALRARAGWAAVLGASQFRKRDRLEPAGRNSRRLEDQLLHTLLVGWGANPDAAHAALRRARRAHA